MSTMTRVSDATGRIDLRRRRDRRRRWLFVALAAVVVAVLAGLAWLLLFSTVFGVRTVEVSGAKIANADDVRRLADVPAGTPLARVDLDAVATRVAGLPAVDTVTVTRNWPNAPRCSPSRRPAGTGSPTTRA
jgi:cell division protein FtsQ